MSQPEVLVRAARRSHIVLLTTIATAACAGATVRQYGQFTVLAPQVAATPNERLPLHVNVQLARPADVAVFLVVPGRGTTLLFPDDSTRSPHLDPGAHQLATSLARQGAVTDSARLARRPAPGQPPISGAPTGGGSRGRGGIRDTSLFAGGVLAGASHGYLLVYASDEPLSYTALKTRVAGLSIPIDDTEALNTVAKLVHDTTKEGRPWAAYATEFNP